MVLLPQLSPSILNDVSPSSKNRFSVLYHETSLLSRGFRFFLYFRADWAKLFDGEPPLSVEKHNLIPVLQRLNRAAEIRKPCRERGNIVLHALEFQRQPTVIARLLQDVQIGGNRHNAVTNDRTAKQIAV